MKHLMLIMGLILLLNSGFARAQSATMLQNPVAYIGQDSNVYISDGDITIQITDDAFELNDSGNSMSYSRPQWSPDGNKLLFMREGGGSGGYSIMIVESGLLPLELLGGGDGYSLMNNAIAWSPDSTEIAFFAFEQDGERGVFRHSIVDGTTRHVAVAYSGVIGEPNEIDPAIGLITRERGGDLYGAELKLAWSSAGLLVTGLEDAFGVALITPDGELLWGAEYVFDVAFSTDSNRLFGYHIGLDQWMMIDNFSTGEVIPLELPEGARPVGWVGDNLLYRTRTDVISVAGSWESFVVSDVGYEVYDWIWGFETESARLHLWIYDADGEDKQLFRLPGGFPPIYELSGYDIALVDSHEASTVIIRYVTSSVPAVLAINQGASADNVRPLIAHTRAIIGLWDDDGEDVLVRRRYTIDGQYVVYSSGEFEWFFE